MIILTQNNIFLPNLTQMQTLLYSASVEIFYRKFRFYFSESSTSQTFLSDLIQSNSS